MKWLLNRWKSSWSSFVCKKLSKTRAGRLTRCLAWVTSVNGTAGRFPSRAFVSKKRPRASDRSRGPAAKKNAEALGVQGSGRSTHCSKPPLLAPG